MNAKELVTKFTSYFPNLVVEKWLPGGHKLPGNKREPNTVRIMTTDKKWYMFTYRSENDWMLQSFGYRFIKE